jgi:hypothetical protein
MLRTLGALVAGATICAVGLLSAHAQETKKSEKAEIPGGIEGKIKSVDKEKDTLSVTTTDGKARTFTITDDTTIVGPRGGKVRRRLNDPRFHEGLDITVVAKGATATEVHLGFNRKAPDEATDQPKTAAKQKTRQQAEEEAAKVASKKAAPKAVAKSIAAQEEEDDDDNEIVGKVKSYDTSSGRHLLVVTLLNGKGRPFFLSKEVKVLVKGKESKEGLLDPAIKEGTPVSVLTDSGGRKVLELHVAPPPPAPTKGKKAA